MKCGAKCFVVEMELDGTKKTKQVHARTPISARKVIRAAYGRDANILSVKEEKRRA